MGNEDVRCILEFLGDDTFRVVGVAKDAKPRPVTFEGAKDVLVFHRKAEPPSNQRIEPGAATPVEAEGSETE
ncbi:MAG: hypothetical protein ACYSU0_11060 [Planctomycetota bacterium]|jgi:hypothetical protein